MRAVTLSLVLSIVTLAGCGPRPGLARAELTPTGGEVCLPDDRVCIRIPSGALEKVVVVWIGWTEAQAPEPIGDVYEIGPSGTELLIPAQVTFRYDVFPDLEENGISTAVLRVWTQQGEEWIPLDDPTLDRRVHSIGGSVSRLSSFAVMRTDR